MAARIRPKYAIREEFDAPTAIALATPEPAMGEHLISPRSAYTHHGIYTGNGNVIHYSGLADGLNLAGGVIEETSLETFSTGNGFTIKTHPNPRFSGEAAVKRARSRLGETQYNLLSNNCEHFCEWCINGEHRSEQIEQAKSASTKGLVAFTVLRTVAPPQISIPLSLAYGTYCWIQKNKS